MRGIRGAPGYASRSPSRSLSDGLRDGLRVGLRDAFPTRGVPPGGRSGVRGGFSAVRSHPPPSFGSSEPVVDIRLIRTSGGHSAHPPVVDIRLIQQCHWQWWTFGSPNQRWTFGSPTQWWTFGSPNPCRGQWRTLSVGSERLVPGPGSGSGSGGEEESRRRPRLNVGYAHGKGRRVRW